MAQSHTAKEDYGKWYPLWTVVRVHDLQWVPCWATSITPQGCNFHINIRTPSLAAPQLHSIKTTASIVKVCLHQLLQSRYTSVSYCNQQMALWAAFYYIRTGDIPKCTWWKESSSGLLFCSSTEFDLWTTIYNLNCNYSEDGRKQPSHTNNLFDHAMLVCYLLIACQPPTWNGHEGEYMEDFCQNLLRWGLTNMDWSRGSEEECYNS